VSAAEKVAAMPRIRLSRSRVGRYGAFTFGVWAAEYLARSRSPNSGKPGPLDVSRRQVGAVGQKMGQGKDDRFDALARKILFR
jgi:hypothetical protein